MIDSQALHDAVSQAVRDHGESLLIGGIEGEDEGLCEETICTIADEVVAQFDGAGDDNSLRTRIASYFLDRSGWYGGTGLDLLDEVSLLEKRASDAEKAIVELDKWASNLNRETGIEIDLTETPKYAEWLDIYHREVQS